jgi:SAM-dependent methyltransferase
MSQPYRSLEAELHDAFWEAEDGGSEIALMAEFLNKHPGPALEMGAGSGRLLLPLARMGFDIEGVELSQDMRVLGARRAERQGVGLRIHEGDMTRWSDGRKFSALLAPAFTLQLAPDAGETLRHWHGLLENHGGLYLTVFIPYAELCGDLPENEWYDDHQVVLPDGRRGCLKTRHRLDPARQILERDHRYRISGNPPLTHDSQQSIRWFEHGQMVSLLESCGFRTERVILDFDPRHASGDPEADDFDGILTYHATRLG